MLVRQFAMLCALAVPLLKTAVVWGIMPRRLASSYRRFDGLHSHHLHFLANSLGCYNLSHYKPTTCWEILIQ